MTIDLLAAALADIPHEMWIDAMDSNDEGVAWRAIAEALILACKPSPIEFCDKCSHALFLHTSAPDGTYNCGCGMICPRPK